MRIYVVANPASPANIAHADNGGLALGIAVAGDYAYLANDSDGLRIYTITNPASPVGIGHTNDAGMAKGVTVSGNYAYLANGNDGLRIYDISNPAQPIGIGHTNEGGQARCVALAGNYAFLANLNDGLRIYDISAPSTPVDVGHINDGGSACGVAAAGGYVLLANGSDGLRIYETGLTYTTNNGTITITGYTGPGCAVTIPSTINGLPVTSIGDDAFFGDTSLTGITIPNSVTNIGDGALYACRSLTNVTIPDSVTRIGEQAFGFCTSLSTVTIPNNVTNIGYITFYECTRLTAITVDTNNSAYSSVDGVLFDKSLTTLIQCPGGTTGSYTVPESVISIGDYAFSDCTRLTGVYFEGNAPSLGSDVFDADTATVYYLPGTTGWGTTFGGLPTVLLPTPYTTYSTNNGTINITGYTGSGGALTIPSTIGGLPVTSIGDYAFMDCYSLTNVTILNGVTNIGKAVFLFCTNLTSVTLPDSVTSIGDNAFEDCSRLTSVMIPNGVTRIGESTFAYCTSLTSVIVPCSVTSIADGAFADCTSLIGVYLLGNAPTLGGLHVFHGDNNATVYYLAGATGWGAAFGGLTAVLWNPRVTNINDSGEGSLRLAILEANASGGCEITFSNVTGTITLLSPLPALAANITITGPGTNLLTISGGNQVRVFSMNSGTTNTLSGLTIANGMAEGICYDDSNGWHEVFTPASGIANAGSLKLLNCVVQDCTNQSYSYGVGIYNAGDMEMEESTIADCCAPGGEQVQGGGIYNSGTLRMTNCRVSRCGCLLAWSVGGVIPETGSDTPGGGILNAGSLTMRSSVIESCQAGIESAGGGICNWGAAVICGCIVSNCYGFDGGGIDSSGVLAMTNSTIVDNRGDDGAGLLLWGTNVMVGCTVSGNTGYVGGGIMSYSGVLSMLNCTVSENTTDVDGGAGIHNGPSVWGGTTNTTIYMDHCTVAFNTGGGSSRGVENMGVFSSQNSIFAGNGTNDFSGVLNSQGYNLIQNASGCKITNSAPGDIFGADPLLGPLQDNGGPTWTCALLPGSPCIDQGTSGGLTTDQRGVPRPFDVPTIPNAGDGSDIGAFEYSPLRLVCPAVIVVEFLNETGAPATFAASVTDDCAPVSTVFTPPSGSMFPIGVSSVQVQAEDPCGSSAQCTFNVSVLGARGVMSNVLAQLVIVRAAATNRADQKDLDETIADLTEALGTDHRSAPLWLDETHVCRGNGWRAFYNPKDAVQALKEIIKRKKSGIPDATAQNLLDRLVKADRLLAVVSIQDAANASANPGKIAKDLKEVTKGDQAAAAGKPAEAIQHYWHAWNQAVRLKLNVVPDAASGKMHLEFRGTGSQAYAIQASTNLVDWLTVGSCTADAAGKVEFTDPDAKKYPARFYRVVEQ